jgi:hypothetical protein
MATAEKSLLLLIYCYIYFLMWTQKCEVIRVIFFLLLSSSFLSFCYNATFLLCRLFCLLIYSLLNFECWLRMFNKHFFSHFFPSVRMSLLCLFLFFSFNMNAINYCVGMLHVGNIVESRSSKIKETIWWIGFFLGKKFNTISKGN